MVVNWQDTLNVRILRDQYSVVRFALGPSRLDPSNSRRPALDALSVMSAREEFWEVHALTLGYGSTHRVDTVPLVGELAEIHEDQFPQTDLGNYCYEWSILAGYQVFASARILLNTLGSDLLASATQTTVDFQECWRRYGNRDQGKPLERCIKGLPPEGPDE